MQQCDENFLIRNIIAGNKDSFRPLVQMYWNRVYFLALKYVKNEQIAEDIAQEVFVSCYTKLDQYKVDTNFSAWLMKITVNESNSYLRKKKRDIKLDSALRTKVTLPQIDTTEFSETLFDKCLKMLPTTYQIVFLLRHGMELTYDEMAFVLDEPVGTVKGTLFRVRKLLKDFFIKEEDKETMDNSHKNSYE